MNLSFTATRRFNPAHKESIQMQEFLPVAFGMLIGVGTMRLPGTWRRLATLLPACVLAGVGASAVNGELAQHGWVAFLSVDSVLVWLGAAAASATVASIRRLRVP
jgi:hypothetical protein